MKQAPIPFYFSAPAFKKFFAARFYHTKAEVDNRIKYHTRLQIAKVKTVLSEKGEISFLFSFLFYKCKLLGKSLRSNKASFFSNEALSALLNFSLLVVI